MASLTAMKAAHKAIEASEKAQQDRQRHLLVLILAYLDETGYFQSHEKLLAEAGPALAQARLLFVSRSHLIPVCNEAMDTHHAWSMQVEPADNVSLLHILHDHERNYEQCYGRKLKLIRSVAFKASLSEAPTAFSILS